MEELYTDWVPGVPQWNRGSNSVLTGPSPHFLLPITATTPNLQDRGWSYSPHPLVQYSQTCHIKWAQGPHFHRLTTREHTDLAGACEIKDVHCL